VVGLCTGTLAATAVACSRNVLELLPLAVDAVKVAFRVGLVVSDAVKRIVPSYERDQSWSFIVPDRGAHDLVGSLGEQSVSGNQTGFYVPKF
jgi:hypothetical protein